ncbi:MAG: hypothetical protein M0Z94_11045 [Dehalococcoidales bacterium]|nr:hypothetical protein [Dehalococcoidales bacterium]
MSLLILALALLVAGLLYLKMAAGVATGGYDALGLEAERDRWEIKNQQLSYQVMELSAMARVEQTARESLEMGPPTDFIYVRVSPGS